MKQRYGRKWRGTVVLEKTLESPLVCKGIQPVHSEGDQLWDFFGRNDAKAETPVLWPPHVKSWLIGKDSDAGRDWGQEEKGTTEDEMAGCHHWLDGRESEWTLGVGDGQGGLACCDSWGCKESDTTEWLNWTDYHLMELLFHGAYLDKSWLTRESHNRVAPQPMKPFTTHLQATFPNSSLAHPSPLQAIIHAWMYMINSFLPMEIPPYFSSFLVLQTLI